MRRKVAAVWVSLLIMVSSIVILVEIAPRVTAPTTWYVDDVPGGSPPEDFTSIQDAINASSDGDTVFVYSGTYYENVIINKSINLTGENRENTIIDSGGSGIVVNVSADWVNITGVTISNGGDGILLWLYSNSNITDNIFTLNSGEGLRIKESSNNTIYSNHFSDHINYPMTFVSSSNNTIVNNYFSSTNNHGVHFISSSNINFTNNTFLNNGIFIRGETLSHFNSHAIPSSNTVNGKPILYYKDYSGVEIDGLPIGQLILANCTNFSVKNLHINNTYVGIDLGYSSNILITNNNLVSNDRNGIYTYSSSNNIIINNNISNNGDGIEILQLSNNNTIMNNDIFSNRDGIRIRSSFDNKINNNKIIDNSPYGIELLWSSNNTIIGNNVSFNGAGGIHIFWKSSNNTINGNIVHDNNDGIYLRISSNNNTIIGNKIYDHKFGYGIVLDRSDDNTVLVNNVSKNFVGFAIASSLNNKIIGNDVMWNAFRGIELTSTGNIIYHNNIIGNLNQAIDDTNGNQWDNGYPSGGNYWSDFDESGEGAYDDYQGSIQTIPGSDGIVDKGSGAGGGVNPYVIDLDSQDDYPLIAPIEDYNYLSEGWNLISIPLIQSNTNVGSVLSSMAGSHSSVQWYNVTDTNDHWKHNATQKSPNLNDLDDINHAIGFWIYISKPGGVLFDYSGTQPTSNQTIQLHPGWNMVGYPSLTSHNRTTGLNNLTFDTQVDAIQWFDATTKTWHFMDQDDFFVPCRGYWVHSKVKTTWEVPL
jgi:parallel beta-helix repeat protein